MEAFYLGFSEQMLHVSLEVVVRDVPYWLEELALQRVPILYAFGLLVRQGCRWFGYRYPRVEDK
jgi:hypothetical protein